MTLCKLRTLCKLLRRDKCNDILSKPEYPPTEEPTLSFVEKVRILYRYLDIVYSPVRNEIEAILAGLPKVNQCQAETKAYNLHLYIQEQAKARLDLDTRVFKTMLNLGLNTDCLDSEGNTLLMAILKKLLKHHLKGARSVVELLLSGRRQANLVLIAYASSEGSDEPAHPRSLARTFAARSYKQ